MIFAITVGFVKLVGLSRFVKFARIVGFVKLVELLIIVKFAIIGDLLSFVLFF